MPPHLTVKSVLFVSLGFTMLAGVPAGPKPSPGLKQLVERGYEHYQRQDYDAARKQFEQAADYARQEGNAAYLPRLYNNIGATYLAAQHFQGALKAFSQARETARAQGDLEVEAAACANLSAIYITIGDGDAAVETLETAAALLPAGSPNRAKVLAQRARVKFRLHGGPSAEKEIGEALDAAQSAGDRGLEAQIWDDLALLRMVAGDLDGAESALANEYRLWVLFHTPNPEYLYWRVARLRLLQGRAGDSLEWLRRAALQARRSPGSITPHEREYDLSLALDGAGRPAEALQAARRAWRWSADWRQEVLPTQSAQLAADVTQADLAALYARLSEGTSEPQDEVFLAVEESRAASLRYALMNRPMMRERLGPEYTRTLLQWRSRTARWLNTGAGGEEPREIGRLRARLGEIEAGAGLPSPPLEGRGAELMAQLKRRLGAHGALFSFQLAEPSSNVWMLTSAGVRRAKLPGRAELTRRVEQVRAALETNDPSVRTLSAELYQTLFGFVTGPAAEAGCWYLSLDDALLSLPFAALRTGAAEDGQWLVQRQRLVVVPSALWLLHEAKPAPGNGLLAVGDAVHNTADPRYRPGGTGGRLAAPLSFWIWPRSLTAEPSAPRLELPSLAGSGREIERISAMWRLDSLPVEVLRGPHATEEALRDALDRRPATVHFATHVIPVPPRTARLLMRAVSTHGGEGNLHVTLRPDDAFLALSMQPDGTRDGINTASVPAYDVPGSLIVLNGCSSGLARTQQGAGLMGFARAWMSAGASTVVASLWPLADDTGTLFEQFYEARLHGRSASESLQAAQTAMIRGQGWRAEPRHWAAYISAGQE